MKEPSLYDFTDYRDFLKEWFQYKKSTSDYWSYGLWSKKLGLKSTSTLTMIIHKQRHMGKKMIPKFINFFKLNEKEASYLEEIIKISKATKGDPNLTVLLLEQNAVSKKTNESRDLIFDWSAYALREMSNLKDFNHKIDWYEKRLLNTLGKNKVKSVLSKLKENEFIDNKGNPTSKIQPKKELNLEDAKIYHEELMELSAQSVELPFENRALHASTLSIQKDKLKEAKKLIRDFQIKFSELVEEVPGDEVYQLNIQFFPLTK
jgi:uncharacterized protein (TIGR02147 family)